MRSEISFTRIAYGFILMLLYVMAVFQYGVKIQMELPSWEWENRFLMKMGMKRREKEKENPVSDADSYTRSPAVRSSSGNSLFCADRKRPDFLRDREMREFLGNTAIFYGTFLLCSFLIYCLFQWHIWNKIEKSEKNG